MTTTNQILSWRRGTRANHLCWITVLLHTWARIPTALIITWVLRSTQWMHVRRSTPVQIYGSHNH